MRTRSSDNWGRKPGNMPGSFDTNHVDNLFKSDNIYGIPSIEPLKIKDLPDELVPYNQCRYKKKVYEGKRLAVHFFIDDYRFEYVWKKPVQTISRIRRAGSLTLGTDFSLFPYMPKVMQMWNVYRNMWMVSYWRQCGLEVIPVASWADSSSYDYSFAGLPEDSTIAVATMGVRNDELLSFVDGLLELIERKSPYNIICYGTKHESKIKELMEAAEIETPIIFYKSHWYNKIKDK